MRQLKRNTVFSSKGKGVLFASCGEAARVEREVADRPGQSARPIISLLAIWAIAAPLLFASPAGAVQGGEAQQAGEPGFAVRVDRYEPATDRWHVWCSATLVTPSEAISAAHCFDSDSDVTAASIVVQGERRAITVRRHPNYNSVGINPNDVAVLSISGEPLAGAIPIVSEQELREIRGTTVSFFGFGRTGSTAAPSSVSVKTPDHSWKLPNACQSVFGDSLCLLRQSGFEHVDVLGGDSGGSWVAWIDGGWRLFAVHSGDRNLQGLESQYEIAASVVFNWDFIDGAIGQNEPPTTDPTPPPSPGPAPAPNPTVPGRVTNLQCADSERRAILELTFNELAAADSYEFRSTLEPGRWIEIQGPINLALVHKGETHWVRAVNEAGTGPESAPATCPGEPPSAPQQVTNVRCVVSPDSASLQVTWDDAEGAERYEYASTLNSVWIPFSGTIPLAHQNHSIQVRGVNTFANGPASAERVVCPLVPDNPTPPPVAILCHGMTVTVDIGKGDLPTDGDDVILGTDGDDAIDALGGDDIICGLKGNDTIRGGDGEDTILGGAGDDVIHGNAGRDYVSGGKGKDLVSGGKGSDFLFGNQGVDILVGGRGHDHMRGGKKGDSLAGQDGRDDLFGGRGADVLDGGDGDDEVHGGQGSDTCLFGTSGLEAYSGCEISIRGTTT